MRLLLDGRRTSDFPAFVDEANRALAPVLDGFTHVVDGLRVALDGWMKQATSALQGG